MIADWAEWATTVVDEWPDDVAEAQPDLAALERQAARAEEVARRHQLAEG